MAEDRNHDNGNKIKELHNIAAKMESARSEEEVYETALDAAKNILEFYVCTIFIEEDTDTLEIKATSAEELSKGQRPPLRDSLYTKTFINKKSYLTKDIDEFKGAKPSSSEYKSAISVPIGDMGVFQAISDKVDHFDENDLELAELLVSHLTETLKRIMNEKAVRESEKRYKAIFNNTGTAKIIINDDLDINTINNEFEELSGYKKNEVEGYVNFEDFLYERDSEELTKFMNDLKDSSQDNSKKFESKFIDKFGNVKDTIGAISNIPNSSEFNISLLDVTDFKLAVDELQKVEKKYQTIFEKSETAMMIIRKDTVIEMVNPKFVELFGHPKKEIENKISWTELVVEDYLPEMEQYHEKRRKYPDSVPSSYECEVYDKSGNVRKVLLNVGMIPETQKSLVSLTELSIEDEFKGFTSLFDESETGMFILNPKKEIIKVNGALLNFMGCEESDVIGKDYDETIFASFDDVLEELTEDDIVFNSEKIEFENSNGETLTVELNTSIIRKENVEECYILGQIHEIS
ncbi:MAG: PAS domain S-box protein [Candidatus Saliniplasma sp.]